MKNESIQVLSALCERVSDLCDMLRLTRLEIEVLRVIPAPAAKRTEMTLREQNCLYLLRDARSQLVKELEAA